MKYSHRKIVKNIIIPISFILVNCGHDTIELGSVSNCLRNKFSNYSAYEFEAKKILFESKLLNSSKSSFSNLFCSIETESFESKIKLSFDQKIKIMYADIGTISKFELYQCANCYKLDDKLTINQIKFYDVFIELGSGGINYLKLANTINNMTEAEFNSGGIRQLSMLYLTLILLEETENARFYIGDITKD